MKGLPDAERGPKRVHGLRSDMSALAQPAEQFARLATAAPSADFDARAGELCASAPTILQINVGKLCNMSCGHCHVDAGPDRTERMSLRTAEACIALLDRLPSVTTVDITGGAPELNPHFTWLVDRAVARNKHVIDRCNLTVLLLARFADLPQWLADRGVEVCASLPNPRRPQTDAQRGDGAFERSIEGLQRLNAVGYGAGDPRRRLTLVHNPAGFFLPPSGAGLESEYRRELAKLGVRFDRLIAINNMPIARFLDALEQKGQTAAYMARLQDAFNPAATGGLMCKDTLSIGHDGQIYDCDFNQMLELPVPGATVATATPASLVGRRIRTDRHCFGCTAGAGSSCGGATAR